MTETIQALRDLADELERVWLEGTRKLGLFTHAVGALKPPPPAAMPAPDPIPPVYTGPVIVPPPPEPAPPYTGPSDQDMWASTPVGDMLVAATIEAGAVSAIALEAIERWETGHYKSKLWTEANNPGGMKYRGPSADALDPYIAKGGIRYARYATPLDGIRAHARWFLQPRYAKARAQTDPLEQIREIHEAGYAEKEIAWLNGVTSLAKKIMGTPAALPAPSGDLPARIRAAALNLPDPFPYEADTEEGNLGCANVVSHALIEAGALDKIELAVRFLQAELKRRGWAPVTEYKDGDVIVWGPRKGGVHGHIGILIVGADGQVMTVQNSSSRRKVVHLPLVNYDRPIIEVLRAPGGK